jgi:hypothetical protein
LGGQTLKATPHVRHAGSDSVFAPHRLQLFQLKLQLFDLADQFLALRAEQHAPQLVQQQLQVGGLVRGELACGVPSCSRWVRTSVLAASRSSASRSSSKASGMGAVCHENGASE